MKYQQTERRDFGYESPPSWGAWIEIIRHVIIHNVNRVAPLVGGVD